VWGRFSAFEQLSVHAQNCASEKRPSLSVYVTVLEVSAIAGNTSCIISTVCSHELIQHRLSWKQWKYESK
jgi:hypothetical protein